MNYELGVRFMSEPVEKFTEMKVHTVLEHYPEFFENVLGIRIKRDENGYPSVMHHYSVKGREIDFVLESTSNDHYIVEVKFRVDPIIALTQVVLYKKLYINQEKIPREKVIPIVLVDSESIVEADRADFRDLNIKLAEYNFEDVKVKYEEISTDIHVSAKPLELDIDLLKNAVESISTFTKNYSDLKIIFEGFRKYHAFDDFWGWKLENETHWWPNSIYNLQKVGKFEDAIWVTFLEAITDDQDVALGIYQDGWDWQSIISTPINNFVTYLDSTDYRLTKIITLSGLTKGETIGGVVDEYLNKIKTVTPSQYQYFLKFIERTETQYDAYNEIIEELKEIKGIGDWVARAFATWASVRKLLPISPTEKVRISRDVRNAIDKRNLSRPGERYEDTILRIAGKYGVSPELIERGLFKMEHG